jgi:hypothetical protein
VLAAELSILAYWALLVPGGLRFSIEKQFGAVHVPLRMRGITWETGGTMNMARLMCTYACLIRGSRVYLWRPRARGVTSPACLCVAVAQGLDAIG